MSDTKTLSSEASDVDRKIAADGWAITITLGIENACQEHVTIDVILLVLSDLMIVHQTASKKKKEKEKTSGGDA